MGNTTDERVHGWTSEPSGRGSWGILSTCVLTLALCVWTALHPNVSKRRESKFRDFVQPFETKFVWVLAGIFAPEAVVYMAWGQWINARAMTSTVRRLRQRVCYHEMHRTCH